MAIGDQAIAAGMAEYKPTDPARIAAQEIMRTRDYVALFGGQVGKHTVAALTNAGSNGVIYWAEVSYTFPRAFLSLPRVTLQVESNTQMWCQLVNVTVTGFTARVYRVGAAPVTGHTLHWMASNDH